MALIHGVDPRHLAKKAEIMRVYAWNALLKNASPPNNQRKLCDMLSCSGTDAKQSGKKLRNWIRCDICGRWLHLICAGLVEAPKGDYECPICTALYK